MVPAYERKIAKTQYVYESVLLRKIIGNSLVNKFSKKYTFYGLNDTFATATKVMECCVLANECRVIEEYEKRKNYLRDALGHLILLSIKFESVLEYNNDLKEGTIGAIIIKIDNLTKLIKGVLTSDKQRYNFKQSLGE